ncbi:MAG: DUF2306 domain-containing protein, partial [Planctomycetota bacterium]
MIRVSALNWLVRPRVYAASTVRMPDWVFPFGAVIVVIAALVWLAPIVQAYLDGSAVPRKVRNNSDRAGLFVVHVLTGTAALLVGALQMHAPLRAASIRFHRHLGPLYVCFVLISATTSLGLSPRLSTFGTEYLRPLAAVLWTAFTILAVIAIRNADNAGHRRWMTRSYAFTYMGLTFLILSAVGKNVGMPLEYRYPLVIWLSF